MITAAEARERAKLSDTGVERHLENIGKAIEAQADIGKRSMFLANTAPYDIDYQVKEPKTHCGAEYTPLQKRLQERLSRLGFETRIEAEQYDANKTRGLGCSDPDAGENMKTRYWITVNW